MGIRSTDAARSYFTRFKEVVSGGGGAAEAEAVLLPQLVVQQILQEMDISIIHLQLVEHSQLLLLEILKF